MIARSSSPRFYTCGSDKKYHCSLVTDSAVETYLKGAFDHQWTHLPTFLTPSWQVLAQYILKKKSEALSQKIPDSGFVSSFNFHVPCDVECINKWFGRCSGRTLQIQKSPRADPNPFQQPSLEAYPSFSLWKIKVP